MRLTRIALCLVLIFPILGFDPGAKKSSVSETDINALKPGEYIWEPELAPSGSMTVVVNLPAQRAYVYRNGVMIGASTISSGKPGYETPTGIFTILQKDKTHRSKKYNNAPMPYTQRLTWDGVALHAGGLPGYPSSHGCVHLPLNFSRALFDETSMGMTVVVTKDKPSLQAILAPGVLAPGNAHGGSAHSTLPAIRTPAETLAKGEQFIWRPDLAPKGPVTILISSADQRILILRNGVVIGRSRVDIPPNGIVGTQALQLASFASDGARNWVYIGLPGHEDTRGTPFDMQTALKKASIPPDFLSDIRSILILNTTILLTDQSMLGNGAGTPLTVMASS